jgi:6-phosphogluconate dehydrogenase (decarboxylating)
VELGIIGLGRMGANMSERLALGGHRVIGNDRSPTMFLFACFASRQDDSFAAKLIAALRNEFGGHAVKKE